MFKVFGGKKKNIDKAAWCKVIFSDEISNADRFSDDALERITGILLAQDIQIIRDSVRIIQDTKRLDTKLGRIDLCQKKWEQAKTLGPFLNLNQEKIFAETEALISSFGVLNEQDDSAHTVHVASVSFDGSMRTFDYLYDGIILEPGDQVVVNTKNGDKTMTVKDIIWILEDILPLPKDQYKRIIRKL